MPSASGQRTGLRYVSESSYGVASGTTFKALRFKETSLNMKKAIFQSNEIRPDRQRSDVRHGMRSVSGDIGVELGLSSFDDLIEAALAGTWTTVTTGSMTLEANVTTNIFERTTGSFLADGFLPGMEVTASGFVTSGNNGRTRITAVTALEMTVAKTLAADAAASGCTLSAGRICKAGTTMRTLSIERAFTDVDQFLLYKGCAIDAMKLSVKPEEIVSAMFTILGQEAVRSGTTAASTAVTAAATNSPFDAFAGNLFEGTASVLNVTGIDLDLTNGRSVKGVLGSNKPQEVHEGGCEVNATVNAFFPDGTLIDKFINETESALEFLLLDPNGVDFHKVRLPRIKYTGSDLDNPKEGPVVQTLPVTAILDSVSGTNLWYQRSNVA